MDWTFRLQKEAKNYEQKHFITLTYDENNVPKDSKTDRLCLRKSDLQKFFKRLRKRNRQKIKYYAVGEYGGETKRPHYHAILFGADSETVKPSWEKGRISVDPVTTASIKYVTNYLGKKEISKGMKKHHQPFSVMSKNLGWSYLEEYSDRHKKTVNDDIIWPGGYPGKLPRYYKERIFTKDELQQISDKNQHAYYAQNQEVTYKNRLVKEAKLSIKQKQTKNKL